MQLPEKTHAKCTALLWLVHHLPHYNQINFLYTYKLTVHALNKLKTWYCRTHALCTTIQQSVLKKLTTWGRFKNFTFCWPYISIYACNETNLMHCLSSVYSVTIPLQVSSWLVANHLEPVRPTDSQLKHTARSTNCFIYTLLPPDDRLLASLKPVDWYRGYGVTTLCAPRTWASRPFVRRHLVPSVISRGALCQATPETFVSKERKRAKNVRII
jgi:hypothetical protein